MTRRRCVRTRPWPSTTHQCVARMSPSARPQERALAEPDRVGELEERLAVVRLPWRSSRPRSCVPRAACQRSPLKSMTPNDQPDIGAAVAVDAEQSLAAQVEQVRGLGLDAPCRSAPTRCARRRATPSPGCAGIGRPRGRTPSRSRRGGRAASRRRATRRRRSSAAACRSSATPSSQRPAAVRAPQEWPELAARARAVGHLEQSGRRHDVAERELRRARRDLQQLGRAPGDDRWRRSTSARRRSRMRRCRRRAARRRSPAIAIGCSGIVAMEPIAQRDQRAIAEDLRLEEVAGRTAVARLVQERSLQRPGPAVVG